MTILHYLAKVINMRQFIELRNTILIFIAHFKKQKIKQIPKKKQLYINNNEFNTNNKGDIGNTNIDMDEKQIEFWNQSINEFKSDSECKGYSNLERDLKPEIKIKVFKTEKKNPPSKSTKRYKMEYKKGKKFAWDI